MNQQPCPIQEYLSLLWPNHSEIHEKHPSLRLVLFAKKTKSTKAFQLNEGKALIAEARKVASSDDIYLSTSLQDQEILAKMGKTRSELASAAMPGFTVDLDYKHEAHASGQLPSREQALEVLTGLPLPPTRVLHTGHGFLGLWLFDEPMFLPDDEARSLASAMSKGWQAHVRSRLDSMGLKLDSTSDLSRLIRIPGTWNRKIDSMPVEVTYEPAFYGPRHSFAAFEAHAAPLEVRGGKSKKSKESAKKTEGGSLPQDPERIINRCPFMWHVEKHATQLPEPECYAAASVLACCGEAGRMRFHESSSRHPAYTKEEADAKLAHAREAAGPATCEHISRLTDERFCKSCPHRGRIKSPIVLGVLKTGKGPIIYVDADIQEMTDKALEVLAMDADLYASDTGLVQLSQAEPDTKLGSSSTSMVIRPLGRATLKERMSHQMNFLSMEGSGPPRRVFPPEDVVKAAQCRHELPRFRWLRSVRGVPVLHSDGTVGSSAGYDPKSQLYLDLKKIYPLGSSHPTKADAEAAVARLLDVARDFPFVDEVSKAVYLAGVLTPVARPTFVGPAPAFLIDANVPGTGKTLLANLISIIATGRPTAPIVQLFNEEEERKRITSMLIAGKSFTIIDNLTGPFGGGALDALLTSEEWEDRRLGSNTQVKLPNTLLLYITGNNIQLKADTGRRCLLMRLESTCEHPETRSDFQHLDLEEWAQVHHGDLFSSALTVLQAYLVAKRPKVKMRPLGSFSGWSSLVQAAVVWAYGHDPVSSQVVIREQSDVEVERLRSLMSGWDELFPDGGAHTCNEAFERLQRTQGGYGLPANGVLQALESTRSPGKLTASDLGMALRKCKGRVVEGRVFRRLEGKTNKGMLWALEHAAGEKIRHREIAENPPAGFEAAS